MIDGQKTFITNSGTPITKCVTITARTGAERDLEHRRRRGHRRASPCSRRTARWAGTRPTRTSSCSTAAACPKTTCSACAARASRRSCASSTTAASRSPRSRSGMAQACLDASVAYAKERQAFGGPIGRYQSIAFKCADMAVAVENARNLIYKAAWLREQGRPIRAGGGDGEALRDRDRGRRDARRGADPRRLRLHRRDAGEPLLPRREDPRDRRGHERDPAAGHRPRSRDCRWSSAHEHARERRVRPGVRSTRRYNPSSCAPPSSFSLSLRRFAIALVSWSSSSRSAVSSRRRRTASAKFARAATIHIPTTCSRRRSRASPRTTCSSAPTCGPFDETAAGGRRRSARPTTSDRQRSDVMMVVHVDPGAAAPACSCRSRATYGRRSPATARTCSTPRSRSAGPALVIQTLEQNFDVAEDQPLPRGRLPGLPEDRRRDRAHQHLLPDAGARPLHRARRSRRRLRQLDGDQALAYARSRHYYVPKDLAEPGAVALELHATRTATCDRLGRDRQRPRPHPAPAVLPAHPQPGRDRQDRPANPLKLLGAARRGLQEPRPRPDT